MFITQQAYELMNAKIRSAEDRAIAAEADLASFIGESPLWISLEGFNRVYDREQEWKRAAIEAQAFLAPMSPLWTRIENLRNGVKVINDEPTESRPI